MKKLITRISLILLVLLFGVLLGLHHANVNPISIPMVGGKDSPAEVVEEKKSQNEINTEQVEASVSKDKKEVTDAELVEKQEYAESVNAFNFYSELGTQLGEMFQTLFSSLITMIIGAIHSFLHP